MTNLEYVPGSFRDPAGRVFRKGEIFFRSITGHGKDARLALKSTFVRSLVRDGRLVGFQEVPLTNFDQYPPDVTGLLELEPIGFFSHPFEWTFSALKQAALMHLEIQLEGLEEDISLIDASAYNIQFRGAQPIFIDHLSFRPYEDGSLWLAHRQFCNQFLNPLLLNAVCGIQFNSWYRGAQEGIPSRDLQAVLPFRSVWQPRVLTHVLLPNFFDKKGAENASPPRTGRLPKSGLRTLLRGLHSWISDLAPRVVQSDHWRNYETTNKYSQEDTETKRRFVGEFIASSRPKNVWDMGCNTGAYAKLALENGAESVIGFDADIPALECAYAKSREENLNFLPLYQEFHNPSPNQGWRMRERAGLEARATPDAILALALFHHLVISRSIPIDEAVDWLVGLAPAGIIEFIPKDDRMVKVMLANRQDIFTDYGEPAFISALKNRAEIVAERRLEDSQRLLVRFARRV